MNKRKIDCDDNNDNFKKPNNSIIKRKTTTLTINELSLLNEKKPIKKRNFHSLDQYTKHKLLINYYRLTSVGSHEQVFQRNNFNNKNEYDVLCENHRFIWPDEDDEEQLKQLTWGQRIAKKYYNRLFKEYCLIDLNLYKKNKYGMRWRTETEVINGKGQFICGNKQCSIKTDLTSWEVLFTYQENNEKKSALIKVRLCPNCSDKLNYYHKHKKVKKINNKRNNYENYDKIEIKEEIFTSDDDESGDNRNEKSKQSTQNDEDETYEELIDKIWRQPIKLESDNEDQEDDQNLENDVDNYLNEFFQ